MTIPPYTDHLRRGVTLVEVMVVVVIIGILSGLAVPKFIQITGENQLDGDFNAITEELNQIRTKSIKDKQPYRVVFSTKTINTVTHLTMTTSAIEATNELNNIRPESIFGISVTTGLPKGVSAPSKSEISAVENMGKVESNGYQNLNIAETQSACKNDNLATTSATWSDGIQICGGTLGDIERGALYLRSTRSDSRAYAILHDRKKSLTFIKLRYMGGKWEKL